MGVAQVAAEMGVAEGTVKSRLARGRAALAAALGWTYRAAEGKSKSKNTPFEGWTMQGKVQWTISDGRIAYARA